MEAICKGILRYFLYVLLLYSFALIRLHVVYTWVRICTLKRLGVICNFFVDLRLLVLHFNVLKSIRYFHLLVASRVHRMQTISVQNDMCTKRVCCGRVYPSRQASNHSIVHAQKFYVVRVGPVSKCPALQMLHMY